MIVIFAPHQDDEIIGCYSVLKQAQEEKRKVSIVYIENDNQKRVKESKKLLDYFSCIASVFFCKVIPNQLITPDNIIYAPDPIYEYHPLHRMAGGHCQLISMSGVRVVFYTVNKNVPYLFEIENPEQKEKLLDEVYPSQNSLWKYEKKYILFEGYRMNLYPEGGVIP